MCLFAFTEVIICKPDMSPGNVDDISYAYNMVNVKSNYVRESCPKIKISDKSCCK